MEGVVESPVNGKYVNSPDKHYISNCGHDENNRYRGGKAGDQSGTEYYLRTWYNRPWTCVLRYPNAAVRDRIAILAIDAALNNKIGYDQGQRTTFWTQLKAAGYDPAAISVKCEADCTSLQTGYFHKYSFRVPDKFPT